MAAKIQKFSLQKRGRLEGSPFAIIEKKCEKIFGKMKKESHGSKDYLIPFPHLREAALVAHHEEGRRIVAAHEVVEKQTDSNQQIIWFLSEFGLSHKTLSSEYLWLPLFVLATTAISHPIIHYTPLLKKALVSLTIVMKMIYGTLSLFFAVCNVLKCLFSRFHNLSLPNALVYHLLSKILLFAENVAVFRIWHPCISRLLTWVSRDETFEFFQFVNTTYLNPFDFITLNCD